jgi:NAD(P)-dependent dehydrogenase (short-subunit alcohol dehydrogenase family)
MLAQRGDVRFDGQVVLVSGAGRGIGRCCASLLAARGAHVIINDLDGDVAEEAVDKITSTGGLATAAPGDVVDDAAMIVTAALHAGGRLDALVNNAGIALDKAFNPDAVDEAQSLIRVHALGAVALTVAAWEALCATEGRIVNTTSSAVIGMRHAMSYAAAKGAVFGFTRSFAIEAADAGVRVNALMPMARTRMYELAGGEVGSDQDLWMREHFPPEAVAPAVAFLASDQVQFTGQIVETSGGTTARVVLAVTPYVSADSPETVRNSLSEAPDELTVVDQLNDMLAAKMSSGRQATDQRRLPGPPRAAGAAKAENPENRSRTRCG